MMDDYMTKLSNLYDGLRSGEKIDIKKELDGINEVVNSYINRHTYSNAPYSETDIQNIYLIVEILQFIYSTGIAESPVSDNDYDILHSILERYDTDGSLDVVGYPIPAGKDVVHHKYKRLRGSLHKVYYLSDSEPSSNPSRKYFSEWLRSINRVYKDKTGDTINENTEIWVMPKFDGVSVIIEYNAYNFMERALLRGHVERNETEDVTQMLMKYVDSMALGIGEEHDRPFAVKCELMMSNENFEKYNKTYGTDYKQSRSIVSSIVNSNEPDERCDYLTAIPLRIQFEGSDIIQLTPNLLAGDKSFPHRKLTLKDTDEIRDFANNCFTVSNDGKHHYRCDGAVIKIMDQNVIDVLGYKDAYEESEVAYKFTEEVSYSKVKDVEFTMGLYGNMTPVIKIKPVVMKGNTIENISIGSLGRFNELRLKKGDTVKVLYDIIPYLTVDETCAKSPKGKLLEVPVVCPECGETLYNDGIKLKCTNPNCSSIQLGRILNYCRKMNIKNISYATVIMLHEHGYLDTIEDLYKLKDNQKAISAIDGFGAKRTKNIIDEINNNNTIFDYELLGVLGIEGCSKKTFMSILNEIPMENLFNIVNDDNLDALMEVKGIKEKTARKVIDGIVDNIDTIKTLWTNLNIKHSNAAVSSSFSVAFTKIRDPELEDFIENNGGSIDNSVTKSTSLLIVLNNYTESSKVDKARKYNIPIVTISNAKDYISRNLIKK